MIMMRMGQVPRATSDEMAGEKAQEKAKERKRKAKGKTKIGKKTNGAWRLDPEIVMFPLRLPSGNSYHRPLAIAFHYYISLH